MRARLFSWCSLLLLLLNSQTKLRLGDTAWNQKSMFGKGEERRFRAEIRLGDSGVRPNYFLIIGASVDACRGSMRPVIHAAPRSRSRGCAATPITINFFIIIIIMITTTTIIIIIITITISILLLLCLIIMNDNCILTLHFIRLVIILMFFFLSVFF